jgi:hypothetical protein
MKKQILIGALMMGTIAAQAQKIDFDRQNKFTPTENGYTQWIMPTIDTPEGSQTQTFGTVKVTVSHGKDTKALMIMGMDWKDGLTTYNNKLAGDGITAKGDDKSVITEGRVAINITVSGLEAGQHTLQAYHNYVELNEGAVLPDIHVSVNDEEKTTVAQTARAQNKAASAVSTVAFTVASPADEVVITYYTAPDAATTYATTSFFINSLEFDGTQATYLAQNPYPADLDYHAKADNGLTLRWTPAAGATAHRLYFGEDSTEVANATIATEITTPAYSMNNLSPLKRYYWRVDEVIDGTAHKGDVWSFQPRRDAFPGAEGYGRYAIGGRGGTVYHVTSLDDDVSNPQPGTFRYGITRLKGPRTIVFDIAGVIELKGRLTCSDKYVTIAGQTAPGRGIMFRGAPFGMASDGITRFVRMRLGHKPLTNGVIAEADAANGLDGMGMAGNDHSIMDHCSISWTIDEAFSSRNAKNLTLQRTLISEALNVAGHPNYSSGTGHGYAATIGGGELSDSLKAGSYHHNLLAHCEGRNWSLSGGLDGAGAYDGHHDIFNNVCYNWGGRATDGGTHECNFVNNYYKMGPATTQRILLKADLEGTGTGTQSYYVNGNIRENTNGTKTKDAYNTTYRYTTSNGQVVDWTVFVEQPFFESMATVETAEEAYQNVLSDVGCNLPELDNHDQRMVSETLNGTTTTTGYRTGKKGLIDSETDSEDFSGLNIETAYRPADYYQDGDGIPDWFENAVGTSKTAPNNNDDRDGDGYTDLEEYLNWVAQPHFIVKAGESRIVPLPAYFAGYKSFTAVTEAGKKATIDGTNLIFSAVYNGLFAIDVKATDASTGVELTRQFHFCVADVIPETEVGTGIYEIENAEQHTVAAPVYNLAGQRLQKAQKGLNIQSGRKFVVK